MLRNPTVVFPLLNVELCLEQLVDGERLASTGWSDEENVNAVPRQSSYQLRQYNLVNCRDTQHEISDHFVHNVFVYSAHQIDSSHFFQVEVNLIEALDVIQSVWNFY